MSKKDSDFTTKRQAGHQTDIKVTARKETQAIAQELEKHWIKQAVDIRCRQPDKKNQMSVEF